MKALLFANTDWYLYNFRLGLALELQRQGVQVLLVSPPGEYGELLRQRGLRWIAAPLHRRSLGPWRELRVLLWLWRQLRRERPDLVHGFTIKCAVYASLAARCAGVPARVSAVTGMGYVFTSQDLRARLLRPLVSGLMRLALGGSRKRLVLQNHDDAALFLRSRLVEAGAIRLIPSSGVDLSRFGPGDPPPREALPQDAPRRVLLAARLLWDKGLAEYVEAARRLRAAGRPLRFLLAGTSDPGNPAAVPESRVREWHDEGVIEWLGHVEDMPALFRSVDLVVLPSYREGCPKSLVEAAACGLPLVATDVPGCRDVVRHEHSGLLVPARDADALAAAIARLHDDPALAARLGAAASAHARREYDERGVVARTLAVYRELLPHWAGATRSAPQPAPPAAEAAQAPLSG